MMREHSISFSKFLCGICFAVCLFAFMLTEAFINERCAKILGNAAVNPVYTLGLVCTGLGFLTFPLFCRLYKSELIRKAAFLFIGTLYLVAAVCLLFMRHPVIFLISSAMSLLLLGHIGSCVYYNSAVKFFQSRYTGRILGIGMGAAILLQCIVENLMPQPVTFIISVFLSDCFMHWVCFWQDLLQM